MAIKIGISEDNEFLVTFPGVNNSFTALLGIMRKYGGKFNHNKRSLTGDIFSKVWVFDSHFAGFICGEIKREEPGFTIPSWVGEQSIVRDKDFVKFRSAVDPDCVKSDWAGDFQRKGVLKGISQNRLALFWEMGLGKSFTIQTVLNHLVRWERVNKYVILSPPEGVINIALECIRFSSFNLAWDDIYIVDPAHRTPFDCPEKKVIIMTYRGLIMLHDDAYKNQNGKRGTAVIRKNYIPWEKLGDKLCIVADESHNIKNSKSKTWRILDKAKQFFEYRYIMTGTPAPKYAADLWTQMRFLHEKSVASDYYLFLKSIANVGNRFSNYAVNFYYENKVKDFLAGVEYLISREKTAGNLELPPIIYEPIRIQMPPKQERLYRAIVNLTITTIRREGNGRISFQELRNKFPYLSLALHDPCVIQEGKIEESMTSPAIVSMLRGWDIAENGKYETAKSLIGKYADEDRKIILWSGHPKIIDSLAKKFKEFNPYILHGGVVINKGESVSERNAAICGDFVKDRSSSLLIANYDCLSSAVNLVEVTRMVFWDRSFEADVFNQALKRANRIGSTEPLVVNTLIFFNSIEEYQNKEIEKRTNFNNSLWEGCHGAGDVIDGRDILTLDDCREILAGTMTK
jgi:SNF2 family DNA or RNA helicase